MKSPKKIILIEDETMLADALVEDLTEQGYEVHPHTVANSAFEQMKTLKPDLILVDLVLPNLDGYGVLKEIRSNMTLDDVPIMVLSNLSEDENIEKAYSLGAIDFLVKAEMSLAEIVERVNKVLLS